MEEFDTPPPNIPSPLETMQSLGLDYSVGALIAGTIFGLIGIWLFRKGRRESHMPNVMVGLGLMIYPLFVTSTLYTWVVGLLLCGVSYYYWPY
ncbi:hypothetical protein B9G69_012450 [Bdellovibrio sp. SKB1291214]|uniref:hypothetical protein n=1 Tax=Bdellovibrio sp. SKB1291214 TaxID=1732569 RepID=UPI000B516107|nr:hypothetical protein [Bdellovibrio sp. SKB1291214]UYL07856.1 hypothetical protein B9G69_012450 [Bdellovibrio sp. SKB1291214]